MPHFTTAAPDNHVQVIARDVGGGEVAFVVRHYAPDGTTYETHIARLNKAGALELLYLSEAEVTRLDLQGERAGEGQYYIQIERELPF